ncbi:MAG: hypothetical protein M0Z38_09795 [Deltaproteobacteria bacterium]|nr:hypothetical protein [Deltaproteobacteria bacterium]
MDKGTTWRTWVISVIVAVILSVTATLLLGGSFGLSGGGVSGGCGPGSGCCPPSGNK